MIIVQSVHCSQESLWEAVAITAGTCIHLNVAVSRPLELLLLALWRSTLHRSLITKYLAFPLPVLCTPVLFDFRYLNLQVESRFYLGSMNEEKGQESSALDEIMVARIEIEGLGVAANEKEMTDSVRALPGVREVKIENGAMYVTYDPLDTAEKKIEEAVRASGNTVKAATTDTETPNP